MYVPPCVFPTDFFCSALADNGSLGGGGGAPDGIGGGAIGCAATILRVPRGFALLFFDDCSGLIGDLGGLPIGGGGIPPGIEGDGMLIVPSAPSANDNRDTPSSNECSFFFFGCFFFFDFAAFCCASSGAKAS